MSEQDDRDRYRYLQLKAKMGGQPVDYKQVIGQSMKDVFQKPAAFVKDLGTNSETMANAMPTAMGIAGGISPIPGGMTGGTALGQGIRDLSLTALKKPVPGLLQHGVELGGAALGDISAIPALKAAHYGGQIGKAEAAQNIVTRGATKAVSPGTVGETLNTLESQLDAGLLNTPQGIRDAKEVVDQIYKNPKIYEKSPGINVQSARVSAKVRNLMNGPEIGPSLIPGRGEPARAMGKALKPFNVVKNVYQKVPWQAKLGLLGGGADAVIRKLLGL